MLRAALAALAIAAPPGTPPPPLTAGAPVVAELAAPAAPVLVPYPVAAGAARAGAARAAAATRDLVGAPYLVSALGEGGGPDPDPRFRLDAFDCMTFVETAVVLGSAASADDAARALDDVRYSGPPSLAARNHEVLSQWIPANVAKGWIAPVTARVAGERALRAEKTYTKESWAEVRRAGRAIRGLPRASLPLGTFALDLVAPADVPALAARLPEGAIAFVVRQDAADRATRVTHAGLVVRGPRGDVRVRHATSSKGVGRVVEEPIERFLRREGRAWPRWPLEGLSFFEIRDNAARVSRLSSPTVEPARASGGRSPAPPPAAPP